MPNLTSYWAMGKPILGKWPWQCTTKGLDNSTELRIEKIRQAVTEIWVPQVWQPPAQPPAHPPRPWLILVCPPTPPPPPKWIIGQNSIFYKKSLISVMLSIFRALTQKLVTSDAFFYTDNLRPGMGVQIWKKLIMEADFWYFTWWKASRK